MRSLRIRSSSWRRTEPGGAGRTRTWCRRNDGRGCAMPEPVSLLMLQFLDWVASRPRTYAEAMDAWRSSCPRLTVWEDALIGGLIRVESGGPSRQVDVRLTPRGRAVLDGARTQQPAQPGPAADAEPSAAPDRGGS